MSYTDNILPKDLLDIINSHDFGDEGGILISSLSLEDDDEIIKLIVDSGNIDTPNQTWEVVISAIKEEKINISWCNHIIFHDDHYLLWEFTDDQTSLYFNGEGGNGKELLADIYKIHRSYYNYLDIERYILEKRDGLRNLDLLTLCNYDNGLFAKGPKKILQSYYNCLLANSKKPYFLDNTIASQSTPDLKLLLVGNSYFIGKNFRFSRIDC